MGSSSRLAEPSTVRVREATQQAQQSRGRSVSVDRLVGVGCGRTLPGWSSHAAPPRGACSLSDRTSEQYSARGTFSQPPFPRTPAGMPSGGPWRSGSRLGEYHGVVRVPRRVLQRLLPERPTPERGVEAYLLQRTRFETIVERNLRRRQLTQDGNVGIKGRRPPLGLHPISQIRSGSRSRPQQP